MQSSRGRVILIVDDNPEDRFTYRRLLASIQPELKFIESETGEDGLRQYAEAAPDCVLLDYRLPDIDGLEFLEHISKAGGELRPIVVLTSRGNEAIAVKALQTGAQDYLPKDAVSAERLNRAVENAIEKVALQRELEKRNQQLLKANAELEIIKESLEIQVEQRTAQLVRAHEREQELRKRAEETNRMKDEFLAVLSHELRTPLNAIMGWLAALETGRLDSAQAARALEAIHRNTKAQAKLVEDLLDASMMITGKFSINAADVNLNEVLEVALDAIRPSLVAKDLHLEVETASYPVVVRGDAFRLQQALINVLSNAVKFTNPRGAIAVRVIVDNASKQVSLRIADTGLGISPEFLPYVFERFRQGDASTTRTHGGLGLGLTLVRHIIELHHGSAEVHSDGPGTGTTITLKLPLVDATGESAERYLRNERTG